MRPGRGTRRPAAVIGAGLLALAAGCGEGPSVDSASSGSPSTGSPPPGASAPDGPAGIDPALAATGYAGHDPDPDRARVGVVVHDPRAGDERLLTTDERSRAVLLDRTGAVRRTWVVPGHDQVELAVPLPDGGLATLSVDQGVTRFHADGTVRDQVALAAHHELVPLADGALLVATHTDRAYRGRRVRFDEVTRVAPDGTTRVLYDTWEHLETLLELAPGSPLDLPSEGLAGHRPGDPSPLRGPPDGLVWDEGTPEPGDPSPTYDRFHLNSIQVLEEPEAAALGARAGDWLLCLRNADLVLAVDPDTGTVRWSAGPDLLDRPHMPRLLPTGRVLVFDNGWHRERSRVVELGPRDGGVHWSVGEAREPAWFTRTRGSAARLANGHTLICVSERGQVLEVTPDGEVVWEWWNPDLGSEGRRRLYRVLPVPADWPGE